MSISNKELKVEDLIKASKEEDIWLPEFQRPFVWDKNQVRLLIDSLFRGYTISSILFWKGGDELARRRVGACVKDIKIPQDKNEDVNYLLDGQQRTTALTLAFTDKNIYRGNNTKKREKVNIYRDTEYKGDDPEMHWVLDDEKIQDPDDNSKMFMIKDFAEAELYTKFNTRFVKIKHAFEFDDNDIDSWFDISVLEEEIKMLRFKNNYNKKLGELKNQILNREVHDIEQKGTLEQVLEVFERINTKNTRLSIFDIMVAKTYRKFPEGYFDLRSYIKLINYKDSLKPTYFESLNDIDIDKIEMILDETNMLSLTMIILNKKFKATEILKLKTDLLMEKTKHLHDKFHLLVGFMKKQFNISHEELGLYQPIMKFLAAAVSHYDQINIEEQKLLQLWFWNTLLKNRYPGAQNERVKKDYDTISKLSDGNKCIDVFLRDNTRSFDYLKNISQENFQLIDAHYSNRSQQIYRALLLLLKSNNALDFYNGLIATKSGASAYRLEEHHIFPKKSSLGKSIAEKYKDHRYSDIINNIANISLITKETNNKRIKNKPPSEYINTFQKEYKQANKDNEFIEIMESQFISKEMIELLKKDDFDNFIIARTKILYKHIEELCNPQ